MHRRRPLVGATVLLWLVSSLALGLSAFDALPPVPGLRDAYEAAREGPIPDSAVGGVAENPAAPAGASTSGDVPLTAQQEALLDDLGFPDAFDIIEMDGADGAAHRYETWRYFQRNTAFVFIDGEFRYDAWEQYPPGGVIAVTVSPDQFPLGIGKQAVINRFDNRQWTSFTNSPLQEIGLEFLVSEQVILGFENDRLVYCRGDRAPRRGGCTMTRWQRLKWGWRGFWRAYHRVVVRPALVRVDPFTLLTIVGILGTAWNMGLATGIRGDADTAVQQLLDAPGQLRNQLDQQLANEQINPFTYNARMEQIDRLASLFSQYAAIYDQRGDEIFEPLMLNGIRDAALSLAPGEAAGKSLGGVSALRAGKGIDALITLQGTVEGFEGGYRDMYRSWKQNPFADIDRQLQAQIDAMMGGDLEPFFAARMRGNVNEMKNIYLDLLRQYPDDPGEAARRYDAILNERAGRHADVLMLAGEGRHWASVDEFRAWLDGLVQDAVLAEGPEADLFADDSWEDEPDEPPANSEIPDDAFEDDAGSASALPDITVTGGSLPGDVDVELFTRNIDFDDTGTLTAVCEQALAALPDYHLYEASAHSYHPGGRTLGCVFKREQDQAELRIAITYLRNVETATRLWEQFRANASASSCVSEPVELRTSDRVILHCLKEKGISEVEYYETRLLLRYRNTELELTEQRPSPGARSHINDLAMWGKQIVDEHMTLPPGP